MCLENLFNYCLQYDHYRPLWCVCHLSTSTKCNNYFNLLYSRLFYRQKTSDCVNAICVTEQCDDKWLFQYNWECVRSNFNYYHLMYGSCCNNGFLRPTTIQQNFDILLYFLVRLKQNSLITVWVHFVIIQILFLKTHENK